MFFEESLTIYNRTKNKNGYLYFRSQIRGIDFQPERNSTYDGKQLNIIYSTFIYIDRPFKSDKTFIPYREFIKLTDAEKGNHFTFNQGDRIIIGTVDRDITADFSITKLELEYEVFTIKGIEIFHDHVELEVV